MNKCINREIIFCGLFIGIVIDVCEIVLIFEGVRDNVEFVLEVVRDKFFERGILFLVIISLILLLVCCKILIVC